MLQEVIAGKHLSAEQMHQVVSMIMDGQGEPAQTAGFLCVLAARGETAAEFAGAAQAMRERVTLIREQGTGILDTCGTGGSGLKTFNISTASAILCAAAGIPVAKHGNRSISSTSGSADVLEQLGVNINLSPAEVNRCIDEVGIGFCFAPLLHSAMKNVGPIRKALGVRTLFNMLGPLTNPARAEFQVLGTIRNEYAARLAQALAYLGTRRSLVLCGNNELDEICLWGPTVAYLVENGQVTEQQILPGQLGLPEIPKEVVQVENAAESASRIQQIFSGEKIPARSLVLINAAAGLWISGKTRSLREGISLAEQLVDTGAASLKLQQLAKFTTQFK